MHDRAHLQLHCHIVDVELADVRHVVRVHRHDRAAFAVGALHCSEVKVQETGVALGGLGYKGV